MAAPRAEVRIANGHRNRPLTPRQTQSIARFAFAPRMTEVILALGAINAVSVPDRASVSGIRLRALLGVVAEQSVEERSGVSLESLLDSTEPSLVLRPNRARRTCEGRGKTGRQEHDRRGDG